jgi:hypothetical protein
MHFCRRLVLGELSSLRAIPRVEFYSKSFGQFRRYWYRTVIGIYGNLIGIFICQAWEYEKRNKV